MEQYTRFIGFDVSAETIVVNDKFKIPNKDNSISLKTVG